MWRRKVMSEGGVGGDRDCDIVLVLAGTYLAIGGLAAADSAPVVKLFSLTGVLLYAYIFR